MKVNIKTYIFTNPFTFDANSSHSGLKSWQYPHPLLHTLTNTACPLSSWEYILGPIQKQLDIPQYIRYDVANKKIYMYLLTTSLRQLRLFSITTFDEKEVPPSTKHREAKKPIRASPALIVLAVNIKVFGSLACFTNSCESKLILATKRFNPPWQKRIFFFVVALSLQSAFNFYIKQLVIIGI